MARVREAANMEDNVFQVLLEASRMAQETDIAVPTLSWADIAKLAQGLSWADIEDIEPCRHA